MRNTLRQCRRRGAMALLCATLAVPWLAGCPDTAPRQAGPATTAPAVMKGTVVADFEQPDDKVAWIGRTAEPPVSPDTQPAPVMARTSARPQSGLWSMGARLQDGGEVRRELEGLDLSRQDVIAVQVMHGGSAARNGRATARIQLTDGSGKRFEGDAFPVSTSWREIALDLDEARAEGLDTTSISSMGVVFVPLAGPPEASATGEEPLTVQTDSWVYRQSRQRHIGGEGNSKSLFVETRGTRVRVAMPGLYDVTLFQRGASPTGGSPKPWMEIEPDKAGRRVVGGAPPSGLMLLDQPAFAAFSGVRSTGPDDDAGRNAPGERPGATLPAISWPASIMPSLAQIRWEVAWASPTAAIIEGRQENGPYDHLGEPSVSARWRLMFYQHGQVYVHVEWSTTPDRAVPEPITWALALEENRRGRSAAIDAAEAERQQQLLEGLYPATLRAGLATALPHRMQTDAPVAMIARTNAQKNTWWWASGKLSEASPEFRRYFGAGIVAATGDAGRKRADCMLMVQNPDPVFQAASFAQYLVPPKLGMRQGELDLTYPGDVDGDGFVEPYGFQAIRLTNGRATFSIYPQGRAIFNPTFLFTVPAAEWKAMDLPNSRLLVTVDGKLFNDPPQFPDGGFLLQLPYTIHEPVSIEAIVVRK